MINIFIKDFKNKKIIFTAFTKQLKFMENFKKIAE